MLLALAARNYLCCSVLLTAPSDDCSVNVVPHRTCRPRGFALTGTAGSSSESQSEGTGRSNLEGSSSLGLLRGARELLPRITDQAEAGDGTVGEAAGKRFAERAGIAPGVPKADDSRTMEEGRSVPRASPLPDLREQLGVLDASTWNSGARAADAGTLVERGLAIISRPFYWAGAWAGPTCLGGDPPCDAGWTRTWTRRHTKRFGASRREIGRG